MKIQHIKTDKNFNNEEMIKLSRETNDLHLRNKVIENNIPLVYKTVDSWIRRGSMDERDDLISLGLFALIKAFDTYKFDKGAKFSTHVCNVIWQQLMAHVNSNKKASRSKYSTVSINSTYKSVTNNGVEAEYSDVIPDDTYIIEAVEDKVFADQLSEVINSGLLSKAETRVANKYFLENMDLAEIARELGITRQATQQSHKRSVRKLAEVIGF
ncbi:RNA polymerase sigma-28 factor precursor [compost metagenome]